MAVIRIHFCWTGTLLRPALKGHQGPSPIEVYQIGLETASLSGNSIVEVDDQLVFHGNPA